MKVELDRMLYAGIIEPMEEVEWIILMVVHYKKTGKIWICVDLRKLNDTCLHVPFPTPFTNEVLEGFGGQEVYSFIDGLLGYHQIEIMKEDRHKMIFVIECGCFHYTMMPFGLKNAPAIFSRIVVTGFKDFNKKFLAVYMDDWTVYGLVKDQISNL